MVRLGELKSEAETQTMVDALDHVEYLLDDQKVCDDLTCKKCLMVINLLSGMGRRLKDKLRRAENA